LVLPVVIIINKIPIHHAPWTGAFYKLVCSLTW